MAMPLPCANWSFVPLAAGPGIAYVAMARAGSGSLRAVLRPGAIVITIDALLPNCEAAADDSGDERTIRHAENGPPLPGKLI